MTHLGQSMLFLSLFTLQSGLLCHVSYLYNLSTKHVMYENECINKQATRINSYLSNSNFHFRMTTYVVENSGVEPSVPERNRLMFGIFRIPSYVNRPSSLQTGTS